MRLLLFAVALLLQINSSSKAETLVAKSAAGAALICSELDNLKIVLEYIKSKDDRWSKVPDCWKVNNGGEVVLLDKLGSFAYVAQDQGNISKGWTILTWWGASP
jgi:hypothetical protein